MGIYRGISKASWWKRVRQCLYSVSVFLVNILLLHLCSFAFLMCSFSKGRENAMMERVPYFQDSVRKGVSLILARCHYTKQKKKNPKKTFQRCPKRAELEVFVLHSHHHPEGCFSCSLLSAKAPSLTAAFAFFSHSVPCLSFIDLNLGLNLTLNQTWSMTNHTNLSTVVLGEFSSSRSISYFAFPQLFPVSRENMTSCLGEEWYFLPYDHCSTLHFLSPL